ncbi:hypothetical protein C8R47DRAFT_1223225 [Mycena vitilis]|nr:hypothetical protein C8R47DRAFT_1223225 [Mycena vitilis]
MSGSPEDGSAPASALMSHSLKRDQGPARGAAAQIQSTDAKSVQPSFVAHASETHMRMSTFYSIGSRFVDLDPELKNQTKCFAQHWTGVEFERATARQLGLRLRLGHVNHGQCPHPVLQNNFRIFTVSGVVEIDVEWCGCNHAPSRSLQLVAACLTPSAIQEPRSAADYTFVRGLIQLLGQHAARR